jgi:methylated-DNA-protein-cysteine methyltransferase-like protein
MSDTHQKIYRVIRKIPRGKVASYAQIARLSGFPNHARLVGYALHALRDEKDRKVPWWRVIRAKGEIALSDFPGADLQRSLSEKEGVRFDKRTRVDMREYGWKK